ncbi:MAG: hypothetical protein ABSB30_13635 [Terracidiphilus sp.]|jgi:hypothetical protein
MKQLAAVLVAVAFCVPAIAQNTTPQESHPLSNLHIVAPAAKPLLLHTGKPLTLSDKKQFLAAILKTSPEGSKTLSPSADTITLTPGHISQGIAYLVMEYPKLVDIPNNEVLFSNVTASKLDFILNAQPNTAYLLAMQVNAQAAAFTIPHFTVSTGSSISGSHTNSEIVAGSKGDNEFAYGVVSNSEGKIVVTIYSTDTLWSFLTCEITSSKF